MRLVAVCTLLAIILAVPAALAQDYRGRSVTEVNIRGLERVSEQVVRARIEVQPGQAYNPRAIARDIRRIYELNYFTQINADANLAGSGVILTYVVEEKRVIEEVKIVGNKKMKTRRVRGVLTQREGDSFVAEAWDDEREAVLGLYEEKGFANTKIDMVVEEVGASRVRIIYTIDEGRKARISSIGFEGNEALSKRKLKKTMKTRRARWFLGGRYEEAKFENDLEMILDVYGDVGRLEAGIPKTDLVYTDNGKRMKVTVFLEEGPEYSVETLDLAGNNVFDDDEILDILGVHAGDIHNKGQVVADAGLVSKGYQDSGYVNAAVVPQVTLNRERKTTHVVHQVIEGDLKYVREVRITGNEITKDEVIRRQMMLTPEERFDGTAMKASRRTTENTQYFDSVRLTLQDAMDDERYTDVMVDVAEGDTGNFSFGGGYNTEEGIGGFAELRLSNFDITNWPTFSGGGQQFRMKLNIGQRLNEYFLGFTDPEIGGYPIALGFDIFAEDYEVTGGADYTQKQAGVQLRFAKSLSPYVTLRNSYLYVNTDLQDLPFFVNPEIRQQRGKNTTISTVWQIERNTLDSFRDPSTGSKHILSMELAGLGGDYNFVKFQHDSVWYRPLGAEGRWIGLLRLREGWMTEYGSSDYVPLQDRFYAGGSTTVRGYDNRDIGPKEKEYIFFGDTFAVGGNMRFIANLEVKYKITDVLRVYGFVDGGGVWEDESTFDFGDMRYSAGLGIGFDIPRMGPIRVDYGFAINPDDDQGSGRLHLMTGFRF